MNDRPSRARWTTSLAVAALSVMVAACAWAHEELGSGIPPLTEREALEIALSKPELADVVAGGVDEANADALAEQVWPNPVFSYSREQVNGGPGASQEDFASLTQTVDLSGRRRLRGAAARERVALAREAGGFRLLRARREIRLRFFEVLLHRRRLVAIEAWTARMTRVTETIARREMAGDVSGYDRKRLQREAATALALHQTEHAAADRARERLVGLLANADHTAEPGWPNVVGSLLPAVAPPPLDDLLAEVRERPDLRALAKGANAASLDGRAAERWWIPELTLGAGIKSVEIGGDRSTGFLVSTAIPLPVTYRKQDARLRGAAQARVAHGEWRLRLAEALGEVRGYRTQATQLDLAARQLQDDALTRSPELVSTAEAAYGGGELTIVGLLDAYRSAFEAEIKVLSLEMDARRARIELDYVTGGASE